MSDITMSAPIHAVVDRQPPRALSPRGFGSRERILKRCRELMVAGTFRPTAKQLSTPTLTLKVIRYYFDTLEGLYLAALDAPTELAITGQVVRQVEFDDIERVAHAVVFGRLRT